MSRSYDYSLDREAVAVLMWCSSREQRFLTDALSTPTRYPHAGGDYSFRGHDGRENRVIDLGGFVLTFWTDDAARIVRVSDYS